MIDSGCARDLDPRPGKAPLGNGVADRDHRARIAAEVAHGGEAAARHLERVGQPDRRLVGDRIFLGVVIVPGLAAGAGEMHVRVGHARHDGAAALVDDDCARRRGEARVDSRNAPIVDDDGGLRRARAVRHRRSDDRPGLHRFRRCAPPAMASAAAPASKVLSIEVPLRREATGLASFAAAFKLPSRGASRVGRPHSPACRCGCG